MSVNLPKLIAARAATSTSALAGERLSASASGSYRGGSASGSNGSKASDGKTEGSSSDGLPEVEQLSMMRFTQDDRVHEVCRMLRSSHHVYLKVEKTPDVSGPSTQVAA